MNGAAEQKSLLSGTRLSTLLPGEKGVVLGYEDVSPLNVRLRELGLVKGTSVTLLRFAPFGDPMELKVRGSNISLRKQDAARIFIERSPLS